MSLPKRRNNHLKASEIQLAIGSMYSNITALEPVPFKRPATTVYLDNVPWRTMPAFLVDQLKLAVGQLHESSFLGRQVSAAERRSAMGQALQLLGYRARSRAELKEYLERRCYSLEAIDGVLEKLEKSEYLNDRAFVRGWINERVEVRGYGRQRIRSELLAKGISVGMIGTELTAVYTPERERNVALNLARQTLARYAEKQPGRSKLENARRGLKQAMLRRGFDPALAEKIILDTLSGGTRGI